MLALSLTEFFAIPFFDPAPARTGRVRVSWGSLNIRSRPDAGSAVLDRVPNGAALTLGGEYNGWYLVRYNGTVGYASGSYIALG